MTDLGRAIADGERLRRETSAERGDKYLRLHNEGLSFADIARRFGVSRQGVGQAVHKAERRRAEK
jgi:hypothetical protein